MSYIRNPLSNETPLGKYLDKELRKIENQLLVNDLETISFKVWHVEPDKPRTAQLYYADGSDWNPISGGEGLYIYLSGGAWSKL